MGDVENIKSKNDNLRKIQTKLLQWESQDNPLAPLTQTQKDAIFLLSQGEPGNNKEVFKFFSSFFFFILKIYFSTDY